MIEDLEANFREAMAHVSAPVSIVTTMVEGTPHGSTVSAFASLSVHPPMVLLALDNRGSLVNQIRSSGRLGLNVLASDQAELAKRFATRGIADRFSDVDWEEEHGIPRLAGITAWLRCDRVVFEPGGDHTVLLATVTTAQAQGGSGLTYYRRRFGSADLAISEE